MLAYAVGRHNSNNYLDARSTLLVEGYPVSNCIVLGHPTDCWLCVAMYLEPTHEVVTAVMLQQLG